MIHLRAKNSEMENTEVLQIQTQKICSKKLEKAIHFIEFFKSSIDSLGKYHLHKN